MSSFAKVVALLVCLSLSVVAEAQKPVSIELGFQPQRVYAAGDLDTVNVFNGNLVLTIPIGLTYPVSSNLSYGLTASYNSKIWDYKYVQDIFGSTIQSAWAKPNIRSNAGAGWRVSLGRIIPPVTWTATGYRESHGWVYEGPSGDEHEFFSNVYSATTHSPWAIVQHTSDGSFIRLVLPSATICFVETPDNLIRMFQFENNAWRLKTIEDRFANKVTMSYVYDNASRVTEWKIADPHGRSHRVVYQYFNAMDDSIDRGMNVDYIELSGVDGTKVKYEFSYDQSAVRNGCYHTYQAAPATATFPKLSSIGLPDGTSYQFAYYDAANTTAVDCHKQGLVSGVTLPTLGSITYTYGLYTHPAEDTCSPVGPTNSSPGVTTRTAGGHTWTYSQIISEEADVTTIPNAPAPCPGAGPDSPREWPQAPRRWARTSILSPPDAAGNHTRTDHYFNIYASATENYDDARLHGEEVTAGAGFGAPVVSGLPPASQARLAVPDLNQPDASAQDGITTRYLSQETWGSCDAAGNCVPASRLRSMYRWFTPPAQPAAPRPGTRLLVSERTVFHDDTGCSGQPCWILNEHTDNDSVGHMRKTTTTSNFTGAQTEVRNTNYWAFTENQLNDSGFHWILTRFTDQSRTLGTATTKSQFWFGFGGELLRKRFLAGAGVGTADLISDYSYDTAGNLTTEKSYGGDKQPVSTEANLDQVILPPKPVYWNEYTYSGGVLATSSYVDPATSTALSFKTLDYTVNTLTGLVTASKSTDGLSTSFGYEPWGAITSMAPPGETATTYTYSRATATTPATVVAKREPNTNVANDEVTQTYEYDGMGRLSRVERTLPGAGCTEQVTEYDSRGRKSSQSPWKVCGTTATATTFSYDALGRVTAISAPDASSSTTAYTGAREVVHTRVIGGASVATRETYDAYGRLVSITENDGKPDAATTTYTYDAGDRLTEVSMPSAAGTQTRTFTYDGRGFLLSEKHPELGASGNGETTFTQYDARGHVGRRTTGSVAVSMSYDAAERLTEIHGTASGFC